MGSSRVPSASPWVPMGSPRRKKRTTGFWAVDDPRADVAHSFPPAAGSAPASGSAASGSGVIRMLLTWHDMMRRLGRFDEEFEEDYDEELHEELHEEPDEELDEEVDEELDEELDELRDEASVDYEVDALGGNPKSPVEPPPAHLYSDSSRVTNPIYYSDSEPASRNLCHSLGCGFLAHSEKGFRGYCCRMCEDGKDHGKRCEKTRNSFLRETRRKLTEDVGSSL